MTWNYRIVRVSDGYQIHEVYYDESGKIKFCSKSPVFPFGESVDELKEDLEQFLESFGKEVLEWSQLNLGQSS